MTTNEYKTADEKYYIKSYGNGWAYEVEELSTGDSLWFQDHDADRLYSETDDFTNPMVLDMYFEMIGG